MCILVSLSSIVTGELAKSGPFLQTGQFERTLIIVDEGASVHYVEGCTAPTYSSNSLHAAIVEIFALDGAYMRYTTIQNKDFYDGSMQAVT